MLGAVAGYTRVGSACSLPKIGTVQKQFSMRLRELDLLRMFAALLSGAAIRICDALLPSLVSIFKVSAGYAALTITAFALTYSLTQLIFGPLGDRVGRPRLVRIALYGASAGAALSAMAPSIDILLFGRFIWGCAGAGIVPLCMAWIGDEVPYAERQAALAKLLIGTLTGMALGQLLGGILVDTMVGWRGAFVLMALAYVGTAARLAVVLRRPEHREIDIVAYPHVSQSCGETIAESARMVLHVLTSRWPRIVLLATFLEGVFLLGPLALVPAWLHARFQISPASASMCAALYAVGGLAYACAARPLVSKIGEQGMVLSGTLLVGFALIGIGGLPTPSLGVPVAFLLGFGAYLLHNTLQVHATQMSPGVRGTAVSLFTASLYLGQAFGVMVGGWSIDHLGYRPVFLVGSVAMLIVGWCFWAMLNRRRADHAAA